MTIDERAAACEQELMNAYHSIGGEEFSDVLLRHLREAVAERDALLRECRSDLHVIRRRLIGKSLESKECLKLIYAINDTIGEQA